MWDTAGGRNHKRYTHVEEQKQDDKPEPICNSYVPIQDIALKTSWEQWTIETGGERGSGRSVFEARHDDDKEDLALNYPQGLICFKTQPNQIIYI